MMQYFSAGYGPKIWKKGFDFPVHSWASNIRVGFCTRGKCYIGYFLWRGIWIIPDLWMPNSCNTACIRTP